MRLALPKSLNGYLLLGIGVITVPLLAAILHATIEMRRLTAFGQRLVLDSVQTTRVLQNMFEERNALERAARLYQVLGGEKLLAAFEAHDVALSTTVSDLRSPAAQRCRPRCAGTVRGLAARYCQPDACPAGAGDRGRTGAGRPAVPDFGPLDDQANQIAAQVKTQIDSELASLRDQTDHAQLELFWESSMLIPLALAATLSFAFGIGRPLRQVDRAITELGGGNFGREILGHWTR